MPSDRPSDLRTLHPYGIHCIDPGWIYMVMSGAFLKIGRSANPKKRFSDGRTWLPDMEIIHVKPFWQVTHVERSLHEGLCRCWYAGEWHRIQSKCDCAFLIDAFSDFDDDNRDKNSIDWVYWMNSTGFADFCIEIRLQEKTLPSFRRVESISAK